MSAGVVLKAIVLVVCWVWCQQVIGRLPSDLREVRAAADREDRLAIGIWWVLTGLVLFLMIGLALPIAVGLLSGLRPQ